MSEALIIAGAAGLATILYYLIGFIVLHAIFKDRRIPTGPVGRTIAFLATRLVILPCLEIVDWLATYGNPRVASRLLPEGLEPLNRRKNI